MRQPSAPRAPRLTAAPASAAGRGPIADEERDHGELGGDVFHDDEDVLYDEADDDEAAEWEATAGASAERAAPVEWRASGEPPGRGTRSSVSQIDRRLDERRRSARRVVLIRLAIGVGVLAGLAGLAWLVWFSSVLGLRADQIAVEGEGPYLDRARAAAVLEPEVGTPLARLDTGALAAAIEEAPDVADAVVARSWPNGVIATLTPREPVAVADAGGEELDLVGADGVVVATVSAASVPAGLPLLTVDMGRDGARNTVLAVLGVLDQLPPELREQVRDAGATSTDAIELRLHSGAEVVWGSAAGSALKAEVLLALLQVEATRYDVSAPEAPTTS